MISLLFFIISIFNGVDDIDYDVKVLSDDYVLSYHYCYQEKIIWGCTDAWNKTIYILIHKSEEPAFCLDFSPCDLLAHEMTHATQYEICARNIGYAEYWTKEFCIKYSNWHR